MGFKDLNASDRVIAVHTDLLRHPEFCVLGSVSQIGNVVVDKTFPTAATDGRDVWYNPGFIGGMSREQLRYVVAHENGHKQLRHCREYLHLKKKYPQLYSMAIDYVVNWQIEQLDPQKKFLARPTNIPPLIDDKYADMSVPEVIRELLKEQQDGGGSGGKGAGSGGTLVVMDAHLDPAESGDEEMDAKAKEETEKAITNAIIQGEIVQVQLRQMAGTGAGNASLSGFRERNTDWRGPLRRFITDICEGDEQSRYSPPNKRMLPLGIILPSHFSESTEEIIVACDTSGSMTGLYPTVFGEIANIAKTVLPKRLRLLWWDTRVVSVQCFGPKDYDSLKDAMQPKGGGGTSVSCVAEYIQEHGLKPKCTILLSDGYVESSYKVPAGNVLWGIVGNPRFQPIRGKVLHISED